MKSKITVLAFCVVISSAGMLQARAGSSVAPNATQGRFEIDAPGDYGSVTRTGIDGSSDRIENFSLDPVSRISGGISGGGMPTGIAATRADGVVFVGVINPTTGNYAILVPAGTYSIRVCSVASGTAVTYDDPVPVTVAGDEVRDEMVTGSTTRNVSGAVSGIDAGSFATIGFASDDGRAGASALIFPFLKTYSVNVPDGNYNIAVIQINPATSAVSFFPVGTAMVSGADLVRDVAIGLRANLTGTVMMASIPANSSIFAIDSAATPPPAGFNCVATVPAGGFGSVDQGTGAYGVRLLTGNYFLNGNFVTEQPDPPQSQGIWSQNDPVAVVVSGDVTRDMTVSVPAENIAISGTVTAALGVLGGAIDEADVVARGDDLRVGGGVPRPSNFARSTKTDAAGNYRLVVPRGLTYTMIVSGRAPMP